MATRHDSSLRYYHVAATVLAIVITSLATYYLVNVNETTTNNWQQTQCNQGLLILATMDDWTAGLDQCSPQIITELREKYNNEK